MWASSPAFSLIIFLFDSLDEMKEELLQYMYYYNQERPHQGINGLTPFKFLENCPRIM